MSFGYTHIVTAGEKLDAEEMRRDIFKRDGYICKNCGGSIYAHGTPQLAHRIGQGKLWRKKYGDEIIYHPLNMWSVCCLKCNSAVDISHNVVERNKLVLEIVEQLVKKEVE